MSGYNPDNNAIFSQILENTCTLDSVYSLCYGYSSSSIVGCSGVVSGSQVCLPSSICNRNTIPVLVGMQRLIVFRLFRKSDMVLLEAVNFCIDRTSEPIPEGFVFDPPAEELETD